MRLIDIKQRRKGLSELFFDCELLPSDFEAETGPTGLIAIDSETAATHALAAGMAFDNEELRQLIEESNVKRATSRAMWYLSSQDHTRKALLEKLCRTFPKKAAEAAADKMEDYGYLNDRDFARRFAESLLCDGKRSQRETSQKMMQKGFDRETISEVLSETVEDTGYNSVDAAVALIEKKYRQKLGDKADIDRTIAALQRKGFSFSDIRDALRKYKEEIDITED